MRVSQFPQRRTKNLLINAGFRVNQRLYVSGSATVSDDQYTLDRWRVLVLGESVDFQALAADNTIQAPSGGMGQKIEALNIKGGIYTIQWEGLATCRVNGVSRKTGESFVLESGLVADVVFYGGSVNKPQIEEGSIRTGFEYVSIGDDMNMCQRFFQKIVGMRAAIYSSLSSTYFVSAALIIELRASPTVSGLSYSSYGGSIGVTLVTKSLMVLNVITGSSDAGRYGGYSIAFNADAEL